MKGFAEAPAAAELGVRQFMKNMSPIKILSFVIPILLIGETLQSSEIRKPLPESFRHYRLIPMGEGGELFVAPNIKTEEAKKTEFPYFCSRTVSFEYRKIKYSVSYTTAPSEDPHFIFGFFDNAKKKWEEISEINGWRVCLGSDGQIYSEGDANNYFCLRRKFILKGKKIAEVRQPFLLADFDCETNGQTHIKNRPDEKSETIAALPDGSTVKILMAKYYSQDYDIHMDNGIWFLVSTPFGLVGWVKTETGYLSRPGKPLSCIRFMGD